MYTSAVLLMKYTTVESVSVRLAVVQETLNMQVLAILMKNLFVTFMLLLAVTRVIIVHSFSLYWLDLV